MKDNIYADALESSFDDIFNNNFLGELSKKQTVKTISEKERNLYTYKMSKLKPVIDFFKKIDKMDFLVKSHKDYNFHTYRYEKLSSFSYIIRDTKSKKNSPSPSIYVENPLSFEISIENNIDDIVFDFAILSEYHPDQNLFKDKYTNVKELLIDLSKFFAKNVEKK